jgi:uncharacterized protein YndB with AHSA1/START domain
METIKLCLRIKTPASKVYRALTEQEGLAGWWTQKVVARPEVGFVNEFRFESRWLNKMKIIRLEPDTEVEWECIGDTEEWIGTKLRFLLEETEGITLLTFTQSRWAAQTAFFGQCSYHWGAYMKSLKDLAETGKGFPNHEGAY